MILRHPACANLIREPAVNVDFLPLVVDEAHCIPQWGDDFRTTFKELIRLRSVLGPQAVVLACSATMTPDDVLVVQETLGISATKGFYLNLGNVRTNITEIVINSDKTSSQLDGLRFLISNAKDGEALPRTIIFCRERLRTMRIASWLREHLPTTLHDQVGYIHGLRTQNGKNRTMADFRAGKINILAATNCAGMVSQDLANFIVLI
jgi:superfamily II DNA helicase RecQ